MAKRSKYTPERVEMILAAIRDGLTNTDAALVAGIDRGTLYDWMDKYPTFSTQLTQAHADRARGWLAQLAAAGPKDFRAIESLLDRCAPDYRKTQKIEQTITLDVRTAAEKVAAELGLPVDLVLSEAYRMAEDDS